MSLALYIQFLSISTSAVHCLLHFMSGLFSIKETFYFWTPQILVCILGPVLPQTWQCSPCVVFIVFPSVSPAPWPCSFPHTCSSFPLGSTESTSPNLPHTYTSDSQLLISPSYCLFACLNPICLKKILVTLYLLPCQPSVFSLLNYFLQVLMWIFRSFLIKPDSTFTKVFLCQDIQLIPRQTKAPPVISCPEATSTWEERCTCTTSSWGFCAQAH